MQQDDNDAQADHSELSEVWQQLLGKHHRRSGQPAGNEADDVSIPTLASDPWRALALSVGIESVDIHDLRLHMSEQDLERILQIMQEQPARKPIIDK